MRVMDQRKRANVLSAKMVRGALIDGIDSVDPEMLTAPVVGLVPGAIATKGNV